MHRKTNKRKIKINFRWATPASEGWHGQSAGVRMPTGDNLTKRGNMNLREGKHETLTVVVGSKVCMWLLVGNVRV